MGFLSNRRNPTTESQIKDIEVAARTLGVKLLFLDAGNEGDIGNSFANAVQQHANAMIIGADSFFLSRRDQVVGLAARHSLPAVYYLREFATAGGLVSYGASITDAYRLAGSYAGRVLKGELPGELPVQQTVKFELVINLKTAKTLGLTISPTLLAQSDEVVE
jgi:putative ABC transport system substrate-binding protein